MYLFILTGLWIKITFSLNLTRFLDASRLYPLILRSTFSIYCISFIFPKFKILQVKQTERPFCCLACFCPLATAPRDHTTDPRRSFPRSKDPDCSARVCQTGEDRLRPDTFLRHLSPNQVNNVSKFLLSIDLSFYCSSNNGKNVFHLVKVLQSCRNFIKKPKYI